jgi:fluoroacetyl-CoA thioesterase
MHPDLKPGLRSRFEYVVAAEKTVPRLYTEFAEFHDMPAVFATAFLVGLIEGTCQKAIVPFLDWPREQSVGTLVNFTHLAATPPGMKVVVEAEVIAVEGKMVRFHARAHDERDLISEGTHERVVVDSARFLGKVAEKAQSAK